ncbi:signal peptidase I [Candidatus Saccharibacteria bacterium]|nr:signal peptidase I [Candidatus Saccharibacteria bacterium]
MDINVRATFFQKHPILKDIFSFGSFVLCVVVGTLLLNSFVFRSYNVVGSSMEDTLLDGDRVIVNRFAVTLKHFSGEEFVPSRGEIIVFANKDEDLEKAYRWLAKADELGVETSELRKSKFSNVSDLIITAESFGINLNDELKNSSADFSEMGNYMTCDAPEDIADQYIIKRVIAFSGERVVVKDGVMTVYSDPDDEESGTIYDDTWRTFADEAKEKLATGPKLHTSGEIDMIVPEGEIFVSGDNREGSNSYDSRNGLGTVPFCRIVGPVNLRIFPFNRLSVF